MIRGNIQKYPGVNLDYKVSGIDRIDMLEYIDDILTSFNKMDPSNSGTKSSVASENLFKVDKDCYNLSPDKSKGIHNLVVNILYMHTRCIT